MSVLQKQFEVLEWAFSFLRSHHREEKVAEILLIHHLNMSRTTYFANMREPIPHTVFDKFKRDLEKHAITGVPVQHLTGYEYFYGRKFIVNNHVLIPRFETEELVHHVIKQINKKASTEPITIIDVGTGSGIIGITLALEIPTSIVYATDISENALQLAKQNAKLLNAPVHFIAGDFLQPIIEKDINPLIIVSNPPYVSEQEKESLSDTVKNFDPALALFAQENGLSAYEKIIKQINSLPKNLNRSIYFEIGHTQARDVSELIKKYFPSSDIIVLKDMNGKDRIISADLM